MRDVPRSGELVQIATRLCLAAILVFSASAEAGGMLIYEVGTPDIGYASAGYAARAEGPATVLNNPAGMTRLSGAQVEVDVQGVYGHFEFSPDALTTVAGNNGGNTVGWVPGAAGFASYALGERLRLGFGVFANFGLGQAWQSAWVGRYYVTSSNIFGLSIMPAVSYHLVGGLSLGAALNAMYGNLTYQSAINNGGASADDGAVSVSSTTWGFGGNVGLLYEFAERSRLGLTYTSPVKLNFGAAPMYTNVRLSGLGTQTLDLGMTVPQTLMLSYYQGLGKELALMADVGWQNWKAFGTIEVQLVDASTPASLTKNIDYLDTWHGALGAQIMFSDAWQLDLGIAYDSTVTSAQDRSLPLAIGDEWRFGAGTQWTLDAHWKLSLAYEFLWGGSPSVDVNRGPLAGRVSGSYADTWFQFISFGFNWMS
jgi:long-chain fatty acid transport protein